MKKTHTILITSAAILGAVAAGAPFAAYAEELQNPPAMPRPAAARAAILDRNRDIRNETMKLRATSSPAGRADMRPPLAASTTRAMMRAEVRGDIQEMREARIEFKAEDRRPMWLTATSSVARKINPAVLKALQERMSKEGSTTIPEGHGAWQKARLDVFATMQSNLISQSQKALNTLKELRNKIADRIQTASQNGRDMTNASQLLTVADQKITAADAAISALASLTPSFTATTTANISTSTEVELTRPREVGRDVIEAITAVRKALNDVVVAIAHGMGLGADRTATTTQQ